MIQDIFRSIGSIDAIFNATSSFLNNKNCSTILYNDNFLDINCSTLVLSKFFGYLSIIGAGKFIVISNIIAMQSAIGLNPFAVYIELSSYACTVYYNYVHENSISTYGDFVSSCMQNTTIILLMWWFGLGSGSGSKGSEKNNMLSMTHKAIVTFGVIIFCLVLYFCPNEYYPLILSYSIVLNMCSKLPQIYQNYSKKRLGVQSSTAATIAFVSAVIKLLIAIKETSSDKLLLLAASLRVMLNGVLFTQCLIYSAITANSVKTESGKQL